jgi:hypothetical protein
VGRFDEAIRRIDEANGADPDRVETAGVLRPRELVHAEMMTRWIERLVGEPGEALLIAARAHHIRRWEHPRSEFPAGRTGYLRWRTGLYRIHAELAGAIARECGYDESTAARIEALVGKRARDADGQALEDALCLVFLETQLGQVAGRLDRGTMLNILRRSWNKMSPAGRAHALDLALPPEERELVAEALAAGEQRPALNQSST